ncbi:MAG TPA: polysaccharide biosynthesis/export family protein [Williamwhitmania sp.]|nr:polysaccharide biosynthesis/export family protein [Williamwhitmania sp.]
MRQLRPIIILLTFVALLSSCNKRNQLLYMKNAGVEVIPSVKQPDLYKIHPNDVLYVQVITQDPQISMLFNNKGNGVGSTTNMYSNDASYYLYGYTVSDSGSVRLPVLGVIQVAGFTVAQATNIIQARADEFLKDGLVIVRLLSYKVTVLGEVRRPGVYTNFNDKLTIFEALALAGDFTDYGKRDNVMVVRPGPDGNKTFRLDLNDKNIMSNEAYYLLPNDVVVVDPRKGKMWQLNAGTYSFALSTVSTLILLLSYMSRAL